MLHPLCLLLPSLPNHPSAFPASRVRGAGLRPPPRMQRGLPAGSVPGTAPSSPEISARRGERAPGTLPRCREKGLQPGGLWQPGTPPWAVSWEQEAVMPSVSLPGWGVRSLCSPQVGPFLLGHQLIALSAFGVVGPSFPRMCPPNLPVVPAWHGAGRPIILGGCSQGSRHLCWHHGVQDWGSRGSKAAPAGDTQGAGTSGWGQDGISPPSRSQGAPLPPVLPPPSPHMPLRRGCRQALGGWEYWLERV